MYSNDLILVRQRDGSYKCSPFRLRLASKVSRVQTIRVFVNRKRTNIRMFVKERETSPFFPSNIESFFTQYGVSDPPAVLDKDCLYDTEILWNEKSEKSEKSRKKGDQDSKKAEYYVRTPTTGEKMTWKEMVQQNISRAFYPKYLITPMDSELKEITDHVNEDTKKLTVTFTTESLKLDVDMFVFDYRERLIVSDIDGTITKSDFRGAITTMFFNQYDWTHDGICPYYSHLSKLGFRFIYLSNRSLSMYDVTKRYLVNVKQNRTHLPQGPICCTMKNRLRSIASAVFSVEDQFKVDSLRQIVELFPENVNPFVCGFGNNSRDLQSYKRVGMKYTGIINSKGIILVNERVKYLRGYQDLAKKEIVEEMFPEKEMFKV